MGNAFLRQVFIAGHIGELLEQAGKVEFRKACQVGKLLHCNIFRAVVGDVIAYHHEFFYIFVLFVVGDAGEFGVCVKISPSQGSKKADHQGINACFRKRHGIVIFPGNFVQVKLQAAVKLRVFLLGDQGIREEGVEQGIHSIHIADQAVIKQQDQPLAYRRCGQRMECPGGSDPNIPFIKGVWDSVYDHSVLPFCGHNDLHCGVPVDRIVFCFFVMVKPKPI